MIAYLRMDDKIAINTFIVTRTLLEDIPLADDNQALQNVNNLVSYTGKK